MKTLKYCIKYWWNDENTNHITDILSKHFNIRYDDKNPDLILYSCFDNFDENTSIIKDIPSLFIMGENHFIPEIPTGIHYSMTFEPTKDNNLQAGYPLYFEPLYTTVAGKVILIIILFIYLVYILLIRKIFAERQEFTYSFSNSNI